MSAKAWRINPRDDYGQLSLGDILNAGGGYFVVGVPTGMDDSYAAHLMAASELLKEALEAVAVPVIGASGPRLCWCPDDWEMRPSGHSEGCKLAHAALTAATPPADGGHDAD